MPGLYSLTGEDERGNDAGDCNLGRIQELQVTRSKGKLGTNHFPHFSVLQLLITWKVNKL